MVRSMVMIQRAFALLLSFLKSAKQKAGRPSNYEGL